MFRWLSAVALGATLGCSADPAQVARNPAPLNNVSPDVFTGVWRSVTPSLEFVGVFVNSKSSEIGVLGTRLTFSGVYWEGGGKIDGDSLVANVTTGGAATGTALLIVRAVGPRTLRAQLRGAANQTQLELTFVRED